MATLEPITRVEQFLSDIIDQGGGGGGDSGGGGVLLVHEVNEILDKTWQEIYDAMVTSAVVIYKDDPDSNIRNRFYVTSVAIGEDGYIVAGTGSFYIATNASGYPAAGK